MIRWEIASLSNKGETHEVVAEIHSDELGRDVERFFCTCPGYTYRGDCRHITLTQQWLGEGLRTMVIE